MVLNKLLNFNSLLTYSSYRYCCSNVRVRFAPSPTGFLHLGGLRTAFYNYSFSKHNNGKFVLRIEDTDQKRVKAGSVENFNSMLQWVGLIPDESPAIGGPYGPYIQSQRLKIYKEKAEYLLQSGAAYRCFCSETRLQIVKRESLKNRENRGYDNKCRNLNSSEINNLLIQNTPFTIRFKIPHQPISHEDIIFGNHTYNVAVNEGDFIIMKSDGFPTYHFACVVDDHLMEISHVLRGTEWLISTPKHIMMYNAFGWCPPKFAHLPLLVNSDRTKLSKRQESIGVEYFKNKGYFPEALLNFLAVAGGGFGKQEGCIVYDLDTLCSKFEIGNMNTNSCIVDLRKLDVFNNNFLGKQFSSESSVNNLIAKLKTALKEKYGKRFEMEECNISDAYVKKILFCYKDRMNNLLELMESDMEYLWTKIDMNKVISELNEMKMSKSVLHGLENLSNMLSALSESQFTQETLKPLLKDVSEKSDIAYVELMKAIRIVLTGRKDGPGVVEILFMLGKQRSLEKVEAFFNDEKIKDKTESIV